MKKSLVILTVSWALALLFASWTPLLGGGPLKKTDFSIHNDLWYYFDNREFAASGDYPLPSMTTHALVYAPTFEFSFAPSKGVRHALRVGAEFAHDFGSLTWSDALREGLIWYQGSARARSGLFEAYAGVFPRTVMESNWSEAFFSDQHKFLDRNMEGLLLRWKSDSFLGELACDWMGMKGYDRKERFQILSAGSWKPTLGARCTDFFSAGWNVSYYHYSGSVVAPGVVDNGLGSLWAKLDAAPGASKWKEISLKAAILQGYHRDRTQSKKALLPTGGEIEAALAFMSLRLSNTLYYGGDQTPFYYGTDTAGNPYGEMLYFCQPLYSGLYDRVELNWEPRIGSNLHLRIGARAHFCAEGFLGWQQVVSLKADF